ncbi:MAG: hypothetical protein PUC83_09560 [Fibrobacter sp.]|nr:hypothetical protein [Fibrobacter sp.]
MTGVMFCIRIFFSSAPSAIYDANPGWKAFMELRRQALHNMQQLSADAEKAGSAGMTLDEINAEIAAARSGK